LKNAPLRRRMLVRSLRHQERGFACTRRMERMRAQKTLGSAGSRLSLRGPKQLQLIEHPLLPPHPYKPSFLMLAQGARLRSKRETG